MDEEEVKQQIEDLKNLPDEKIDTSDIPEIKDWTGAVRGKYAGKTLQCPDCGSHVVDTHHVANPFQYGSGPKAVMLPAIIPYRKCVTCGFQWTDSDAEAVREAAINEYLKKVQSRV